MHNESRVEALKSRLMEEKRKSEELGERFTSPELKVEAVKLAERATEISRMFLGKKLNERRSLEAETKWLDGIEVMIDDLVYKGRQRLQAKLDQYGPAGPDQITVGA